MGKIRCITSRFPWDSAAFWTLCF